MKKLRKELLFVFSLALTQPTILHAQEADQGTFILSPSVPEEIKSLARYELESFVVEYFPSDAPNYPYLASDVTLGNGFVPLRKGENTLSPSDSYYHFPVWHQSEILFTLQIFKTPDGVWHTNSTNEAYGLKDLKDQEGTYVLYTGPLTPFTLERVENQMTENGYHVDSSANTLVEVYPNVEDRNIISYRLYNPNSGEHVYTQDSNEKNTLTQLGWNLEGAGWFSPLTGQPVYRLYNPNSGEHHYTDDETERNTLSQIGWIDEGVSFYASPEQKAPVYRVFNPQAQNTSSHHYTTSLAEAKSLVEMGWLDEGIGWYADLAGWETKDSKHLTF
ncbi:MAG: hypothetical protein HDR44_00190 [Allobaculum sp.]|nr:hypothetical protein [Allobaculum sp.]